LEQIKTIMILAPYLNFDGQCEAAFDFYAKVFNGEVTSKNKYEGAPMEFPEGYENKLMHAELVFENNRIHGSDKPGTNIAHNSSMSLSFVEVFVMDDIFKNLAEGGTIQMPLQDTFWGARFGMLTDKFGIKWQFNCDLN
jgi:PhnB protein